MSTDALLRDPVALAKRLIEAGEEWAEANHAASLLEETKGTLLAKLLKEHMSEPAWKADALAKSDERYGQHIQAMVDAQREATKCRVRYDAGRAFIDLARSAESTRRAEMAMR
jgi:hypothetical protein